MKGGVCVCVCVCVCEQSTSTHAYTPDRGKVSQNEVPGPRPSSGTKSSEPETKPQNNQATAINDRLIRIRRVSFLMNYYAPILETHDKTWVHSSPGGLRKVMYSIKIHR